MSSVKPITPDEALKARAERVVPGEVIEAFNELIAESSSGKVYQYDVVERIRLKGGPGSSELFENGYLDVEDMYRAAGWKVDYDKPAYNESYRAFFTFTRK